MEDGVRRGESSAETGRQLAQGIRPKGRKLARATRGAKPARRGSRGIPKSRRDRVEIGPRGRRPRRVVGDGGLTSEPGMRAVRQTHPLVYAMLVELCRRRRPGRIIRLRRA